MTRLATLISLLAIIVLVLASCGESSPSAAPTPTIDATPTPTPAPAPSAAVSPLDEGDQLFESGQFEKAIDAYTRAIALNP